MNTINHLDLFSGVGGFSLGLREAGVQVEWHGFSDIDKFANNVFRERFPNAKELGPIEDIDIDKLPRIDIVTFGFPCQDLSIAGKRKGFDGSRSSLYFKAIEIIERKRPKYFIFENVKGFFSSNAGKDFTIALKTIADIGYDGQWQLLNTRWFLPQNRERIYFVGHIRGECRPKVFPIRENGKVFNKSQRKAQKKREWVRSKGPQSANCISARYYKDGSENLIDTGLNQIGVIGKDSEATRVYDTTCARTIKDGGGMGAKTELYEVKPVLTPNRANKRQNGRRFKEDGEDMFTLTSQDQHGVHIKEATKKGYAIAEKGDSINLSQPKSKTRRGRVGKGVAQTLDTGMQQYTIQSGIRRLTPTECERLQGFPDGWTEGQSDTQRYKQMGNAVSVPVVKAVMEKLYR